MKLENTYFITQIIAGLAVVISLIFVGISVNQNTAAIERQSKMDYINSLTEPFLDDVEIGHVLAKVKELDGREEIVSVFMDTYSLTEVEAATWSRHLFRTWMGLDVDYFHAGPEVVEPTIRFLLTFQDCLIYWETNPHVHSPKFRLFVNKIIEQINHANI